MGFDGIYLKRFCFDFEFEFGFEFMGKRKRIKSLLGCLFSFRPTFSLASAQPSPISPTRAACLGPTLRASPRAEPLTRAADMRVPYVRAFFLLSRTPTQRRECAGRRLSFKSEPKPNPRASRELPNQIPGIPSISSWPYL